MLLSAFAGLREHVPARLELIGASTEAVEPYRRRAQRRHRGRRVPRQRGRRRAVAPAARGRRALRSFARRRELRDGADRGVRGRHAGGRLRHRRLPPGRSPRPRRAAGSTRAAARAGRGAALDVARSLAPGSAMGEAARTRAADFAWPRVATQVTGVYEQALQRPQAEPAHASGWRSRPACARRIFRSGGRHAGCPRWSRPACAPRRARLGGMARRVGLVLSALMGVLLAYLAFQHVDFHRVFEMLVHSSPSLGAGRAGAVLCLDGASRRLLARDRQGRPAAQSHQAARDPERHHDRSADVRDAAGPPRRAVARADRGAPHRPHARDACRCWSERWCRRRS